MRIVNGYKVYDKSELEYRGEDLSRPNFGYKAWFTKDSGERVAIGIKYYGGYRTIKDTLDDKKEMDKMYEKIEKKPIFYGDELCGWIIYIFIMIFGNVFKDFFPLGMIVVSIHFFSWRKKYRNKFSDY